MMWLWFLGGLVILVVGGEFLVQGASALALKANIPPLLVGLTVVAFGTSTPELFASLQAMAAGDGSIAIGNVLGSNVANLGLALGLTAMVSPVAVKWADLKMHWWVMICASLVFLASVWDLVISPREGVVLFAGALLYLGGQLLRARRHADSAQTQEAVEDMMEDMGDAGKSYGVLAGLLGLGCVGLYFGSEAFIRGAQDIALSWGISTHVVGVTVVAFGTSVPEIVASLTAALRGNGPLSMGNLVGSNILNIFLVLGATASAGGIEASPVVPDHDIWWMLGAALLLAPMVWLGKGQIGRIAGGLYAVIYAAYVWLVVLHG